MQLTSTNFGVLKPDIPATSEIVNALLAEVAVIDREGSIVLTNEAWSRFANENAGDKALISGVGLNYLHACRPATAAAVPKRCWQAWKMCWAVTGSSPRFSCSPGKRP
jgi:two-component system, chemotaxis family, CheB/CheR fusion protein